MELGPAVFFSAAQLQIAPEPPLPAGSDKIDTSALDQVDHDLSGIAVDLEAVRQELFAEAMTWQDTIAAASGAIYGDLDTMSESVPQGIFDESDNTQQAIDGAETSFLPDAYQDTPPWYVPPPDVASPPVEVPTKEV